MPTLSEFDPALGSGGSIDPMGLYAVGDALAVQLVPGVRERMAHPRYLTAMAVGRVVCDSFGEDTRAQDEAGSEPWQVFEWYAVEGLVRCGGESLPYTLPGSAKARRALAGRVPLCATRYLKAPSINGFFGVYRPLARALDIEQSVGLGEAGWELVEAWERDRGLTGFLGDSGVGASLREELRSAVADGLRKGAVARHKHWDGWEFIHEHLFPPGAGPRESEVLRRALLADGNRRAVLDQLVDSEVQSNWLETKSERAVHQGLAKAAHDPGLKALLSAIMSYEEFSRVLRDAFDDCLHRLTVRFGPQRAADLAGLAGVARAVSTLPALYERTLEALEPVGEANRFQQVFGSVAMATTADAWIDSLIHHHEAVQSHKPPSGKAPWVLRGSDGSYISTAAGRQDEPVQLDTEYVHGYRTFSLWTFAEDLGMVS